MPATAETPEDIRASYKTVVMVDGVFDMLHAGHIFHLEEAKALAPDGVLVVGLAEDSWVEKRHNCPSMTYIERRYSLLSLKCVDFVLPISDGAMELISRLRPDIYVKGEEYRSHLLDPNSRLHGVSELLSTYGGRIELVGEKFMSSSALTFSSLSQPVRDYLSSFPYGPDEVCRWIDSVSGLKVLVVGEAIEDIYTEVEPMTGSPREPSLALRSGAVNTFAGGSKAVWAHVSSFCHAGLLCQKEPILKHRYIYPDRTKAVNIQTLPTNISSVEDIPSGYGLIIATDYGHGYFTPTLRAKLSTAYLALCCQTNSANYGLNPITVWPGAKYLVMNEVEKGLAGPLLPQSWPFTVTTYGKRGSLLSDSGLELKAPALNDHPVDTVGAGDAFLAITAPLACTGCPRDIVLFVGSVAAALQCSILGNERPVTKRWLKRAVRSYLGGWNGNQRGDREHHGIREEEGKEPASP